MQSRSRPKTSDGTALGYVFVVLAPTGLWASLRGQGETVWGLAWWRRVEILRRGYCGVCVPRTEALALGAWRARVCGGFAWAACWLLGCRVTRGGHAREMLFAMSRFRLLLGLLRSLMPCSPRGLPPPPW